MPNFYEEFTLRTIMVRSRINSMEGKQHEQPASIISGNCIYVPTKDVLQLPPLTDRNNAHWVTELTEQSDKIHDSFVAHNDMITKDVVRMYVNPRRITVFPMQHSSVMRSTYLEIREAMQFANINIDDALYGCDVRIHGIMYDYEDLRQGKHILTLTATSIQVDVNDLQDNVEDFFKKGHTNPPNFMTRQRLRTKETEE